MRHSRRKEPEEGAETYRQPHKCQRGGAGGGSRWSGLSGSQIGTPEAIYLSRGKQLAEKQQPFPSILITFGRQMNNWVKLYAIYTFSTSPHSCKRTTLLNT